MKKAIVIGATSGIGQELAKLLVSNNYRTGIIGRRTDLLNNLKQENPEVYILKTVDIRQTNELEKSLEDLVLELDGLDLIIISAGIGDLNENLNYAIEQNVINTNISAWTCIANWSFNFFIRQKYGHLVSISSIAGLRGNRVAPSYNASKAYQINYSEGLRQKAHFLKHPIIVTDVRPGLIDTAMAKATSRFWIVPVEKAASQIFKAIYKQQHHIYVSKRWRLFAWVLKAIPSWLYTKF